MYSQLTGVLIPCASLHSFKQSISVIERNRAPTGKKRSSRGRYVAVLSPGPIFERRARPPLLTPPPELAPPDNADQIGLFAGNCFRQKRVFLPQLCPIQIYIENIPHTNLHTFSVLADSPTILRACCTSHPDQTEVPVHSIGFLYVFDRR